MTPYHFFRIKGFTLVETLVAISIIMLAVAGPLYTASRAIVAAGIARDQLTASYLAQEGIEYVRMMRDNHYLQRYSSSPGDASTVGWTRFLTYPTNNPSVEPGISVCRAPRICTLADIINKQPYERLAECPSGVCTTAVNLVGSTSFKRTIQATDLTNEEKITSTVTWTFRETTYTVTAIDHLTPWQ